MVVFGGPSLWSGNKFISKWRRRLYAKHVTMSSSFVFFFFFWRLTERSQSWIDGSLLYKKTPHNPVHRTAGGFSAWSKPTPRVQPSVVSISDVTRARYHDTRRYRLPTRSDDGPRLIAFILLRQKHVANLERLMQASCCTSSTRHCCDYRARAAVIELWKETGESS